jgi:nucleoside-diphosphate-sugar epimerase
MSDQDMETHLITGGAGFIGSHVAEELLRQGHRTRIFDNFSTGKRENIEDLLQTLESEGIKDARARLDVTEGDIRILEEIARASKGADFVYHLAALPSVVRSVKDPVQSNDVNATGTLNVLIAARDAGVSKVVYSSSSSVYGDSEILPKVEDMKPDPKSPYAVSKLTGEYYCRIFSSIYSLPTVSLRYFNVFGPRQNPDSQYAAVIPLFIRSLLGGQSPIIYGDGEQTRDFTYVANVVQANMKAGRSESQGILNIAYGSRITVNDLARRLGSLIGESIEPDYAPERPGDILHSLADIDRARDDIDYSPYVDLNEGLRRTIEWYRRKS